MQQLTKREIKSKSKVFKREQEIILILENIQYARNVASIFRTADAAGINKLYLTGISQKPPFGNDLRKTSRNKEQSVQWEFETDSGQIINKLKKEGYFIVAIEQTDDSTELFKLKSLLKEKSKVAFIAGSEVFGVKRTTLEKCDASVEIPMYGKGASLNVSTSIGIVLFSF